MAAIIKAILVISAAVLTFIAERGLRFRNTHEPLLSKRRVTNLSLWVVNVILNPVIILGTTYFSQGYFDWRPVWFSSDLLVGWAVILVVMFDVLVLDLFIYFWHRANHVFPFLWRFHQVHHADETLDLTSGVRFHFGEVLISGFVRLLVIFVFDISIFSVALAEGLLLVASLFQHGNFRVSVGVERVLSIVFVTPGIHWVHHHKYRPDTDSNYGNIFSFWDLMFGTRSPRRRFSGMAIGIEGARLRQGFWHQLLLPFRSNKR